MGGGESGVGSAVLAIKKGFEVFLSDNSIIQDKYKQILNKYKIDWEEETHTFDKILNADEVIKSPGIPDNIPVIKSIIKKNIKIISEIEFAGRYTNATKICITGSNGKTTTAFLIYHILKKAGLNVGLAGNIGDSFALQLAEKDYEYYVLELSSFQLDGMTDFKAEIAILLNITPDHLDRYDYDFQKYTDSKFRIIQNQTNKDFFIYWADDPVLIKELKNKKMQMQTFPFSSDHKLENGAYCSNNNLIIETNFIEITMSIQELVLQGRHNTHNSMAAGIAASILEIRKPIIRESLMDFQSVEHRLEPFIKVHGIQFVNDSKATNVNSTWYALESTAADIVWIVGGIDKGNDYSQLKSLAQNKVKAIICLGVDNAKIHKAFKKVVDTIIDTTSMEEAVKTAYYLSKKGDTILLSPACASFDLFKNFEDRGWQFKNSVREL